MSTVNDNFVIGSILDLLHHSSAQDVIFLSDEDGNQVYSEARIMRVLITNSEEMFKHALESGAEIADYKITKPIGAKLAALYPLSKSLTVVPQLKAAARDGTRFTLQTRSDTISDMVISELSVEESNTLGDCLSLSFNLEEVKWFSAKQSALTVKQVRRQEDADTVDRGKINKEEPKPKARSLLYNMTYGLMQEKPNDEVTQAVTIEVHKKGSVDKAMSELHSNPLILNSNKQFIIGF